MNKVATQALMAAAQGVRQKVIFENEAHAGLLEGASILAKAVGSTMGPSGHNVIIDGTVGAPIITKDGVTVARAINLKDRLPSMGAELLKEVASKTNELAGDGPQPLYAQVVTPRGWKALGELEVGDDICGTNGTTQKVLGVFRKGQKEILKVFFADGNHETRVVECSSDHLWLIKTARGASHVMTTQQLLDKGLSRRNGGGKYFINSSPVEFAPSGELPLDPYLLGVLLGDGSLSEEHEVEIAVGLGQRHILNALVLPKGCTLRVKLYPEKHYLKASICGSIRLKTAQHERKSIIKNLLKDLGLLGANSHTKFIPRSYLYSSIEDRKKLLAGLIDTDGSISSRGLFTFSTVGEQLASDFVELCRSLGLRINHRIHTRKPKDGSYSTSPIHRISQLKGNKHGLKISRIEKTGTYTEMMCIKVSNQDHLYITNDYVPTHNTTTATVLAHAMLKEGIKMVNSGRDAIYVKKGMDLATEKVIAKLKENCIPVRNSQDIVNVGTISANGDVRIGELLSEAIGRVGQDGIITIEPGKSTQTILEVVEGMQFDGGYLSPYFVTNSEKNTVELEKPFILLTSRKISSLAEFIPILEKVANTDSPLLVVADDVEGEALHTLIVNKFKGTLACCAVKAPSYGENRTDILNDIACVVGGVIVDASSGAALKSLELEDLGVAKRVIVSRTNTTIVGESNDQRKQLIEERVRGLKAALVSDGSLDELHIDRYRKRLAKLAGGVAVVKVGGSTEVEILEKKDRVEDALNATLAAAQEGIVPGGGCALFYAREAVEAELRGQELGLSEDEWAGIQVILNACKAPLETIVKNTGKSPEVVMDNLTRAGAFKAPEMDFSKPVVEPTGAWKVLAEGKSCDPLRYGYDAAKGTYGDLVEKGIIDPVKVTRYALEHASSVVGLMLTCNSVVLNESSPNLSLNDRNDNS